jgi:hypothetical protein
LSPDVALNHALKGNPMLRMWMSDPDGDGWGSPTENPYEYNSDAHSYRCWEDLIINSQETINVSLKQC